MAASLAIRVGSHWVRPTTMDRVELPQPTDGQLIVRIAGGDRGAFDELHGRYARAVLGLALRRIGDRGRAEDATQDAFVAIWRSARTYKPDRGRRRAVALRRRPQRDHRRAPPHARARRRARGRSRTRARSGRRGRGVVDRVARTPRARDPARARAARDRPRVLERPVPERDRRTPWYPSRHGEDAYAERTREARRRPRRGAQMTPDFDELVGTDLDPAERERLERVHGLLIAAGPPPDLVEPKVVQLAPRRRRGVLLALAAAIAVTAFALGAAAVDGPVRTKRRLRAGADGDDCGFARVGVTRRLRARRRRQLADGAPRRRAAARYRAADRSSCGSPAAASSKPSAARSSRRRAGPRPYR